MGLPKSPDFHPSKTKSGLPGAPDFHPSKPKSGLPGAPVLPKIAKIEKR
jgi:hypothetical protein